jgi:hypothetical protein
LLNPYQILQRKNKVSLFSKIFSIEFSCGPSFLLLRIYPRDLKVESCKNICILVFIYLLFIVVCVSFSFLWQNTWENPVNNGKICYWPPVSEVSVHGSLALLFLPTVPYKLQFASTPSSHHLPIMPSNYECINGLTLLLRSGILFISLNNILNSWNLSPKHISENIYK